MNRTLYTLRNSFHNTEARTTYSPEQREVVDEEIGMGIRHSDDSGYRAQYRAWKVLCGNSACRCCNAWGER